MVIQLIYLIIPGPLTTDWDAYAKIAGGGTGSKFRGIIDEFYIFNCSLNEDQIRVVADTCKLREGKQFRYQTTSC